MNISGIVHAVLKPILTLLNVSTDISGPLFTGLFEVTIGSEMISKLHSIPLVVQLAAVSFLLGFNGFSIQAQVASIIARTDIRFYPYFIARILHAVFASIITIILYRFYVESKPTVQYDTPVMQYDQYSFYNLFKTLSEIGPFITISSIFIAACILFTRMKKNET